MSRIVRIVCPGDDTTGESHAGCLFDPVAHPGYSPYFASETDLAKDHRLCVHRAAMKAGGQRCNDSQVYGRFISPDPSRNVQKDIVIAEAEAANLVQYGNQQ